MIIIKTRQISINLIILPRPFILHFDCNSHVYSPFLSDIQEDFLKLVDAYADAVGRTFCENLPEMAPSAQLLRLTTRWHEPLNQGTLEIRHLSKALHKRSVWCRSTTGVAAVDCSAEQECGICFEALAMGGCRLSCGHNFCEDCWRRHLVAEVRQGRLNLRCAAHACKVSVDLAVALRFVSLAVLEQHRRLVLAAVLEEGGSTVFCPNAQCSRPLQLRAFDDVDASRTVRCLCGAVFCFACQAEGHFPAQCEDLKTYRTTARKLNLWRARHEVIVVRVKVIGQRCPKCRRFFEKSNGCNDMRCMCGVHFCYACGVLQGHHCKFYPCSYTSQAFPRQQWRQKTRMIEEKAHTNHAEATSLPEPFRQALQLRTRRLDVLGTGFRFRRRFGAVLAQMEGVRSGYHLQDWRTLFCGLEDILRAAEFALVAQNSAELCGTARRRLEDCGKHLCRIQEGIFHSLESGAATEKELQKLLKEGASTLRAMHGQTR